MKPLFSVIIPAYNIEKYIVFCMDSVIRQSVTNYEVIIVDDGSTDKTGTLCDEYVRSKANFYVYHQENKGLSYARNVGVSHAKGEYIIFLDGDDYLMPDALQNFTNGFINSCCPDVLLDEGEYYDKEGNIELSKRFCAEKFGEKDGKHALEFLMTGKPIWAAFGKAFKRRYWEENKFQFRIGITSEDLDLIYKVIYQAGKVKMVSGCSYCYRCERDGSIMQTVSLKYIIDLINVIKEWEDYFELYHMNGIIQNGMRREFGNLYRTFILFRMKGMSKDEIDQVVPYLKENLKYLKNCKNVFLYMYGYIFGIRNLVRLCSLYVELKQEVKDEREKYHKKSIK